MSHKMILSKDITVEVICNTFVLWNNLMPNLSLKIFIKIYRPSSLVPIPSITSGAQHLDVGLLKQIYLLQDTSTSPFHILGSLCSQPPFSLCGKLASTHASVSTQKRSLYRLWTPESLQSLGQNPFFFAAQMQIKVKSIVSSRLVFKVICMVATILDVQSLVTVQCFA